MNCSTFWVTTTENFVRATLCRMWELLMMSVCDYLSLYCYSWFFYDNYPHWGLMVIFSMISFKVFLCEHTSLTFWIVLVVFYYWYCTSLHCLSLHLPAKLEALKYNNANLLLILSSGAASCEIVLAKCWLKHSDVRLWDLASFLLQLLVSYLVRWCESSCCCESPGLGLSWFFIW